MGAFATRYEKTCDQCGSGYVAKKVNARYCSRKCCKRANFRPGEDRQRPGAAKTCVQCGCGFAPRSDAHHAKYCSGSCRSVANYARQRADGRHAARLAQVRSARVPIRHTLACVVCASEFVAKRRDTKYCSKPCQRRGAEKCGEPRCGRPSVVARPRRLCSSHYNAATYTPEQRREQRSRPRKCAHCGKDYLAQRSDQRFCSLLCRSGGEFKHTYTEAERRAFREARRKRRALLRQIECEDFDEREIYERDRWRCQVCRKRVSRKMVWPHPLSPSLDHIIPLSEPGTSHTRRNVRLVHLKCNSERGNRGGGEQLMLIG